MSDAPEYKIGTIFDMAKIPEESLPRFIAELPEILAYIRRVDAVSSMMGDVFGDVIMSLEAVSWVDDGLGEIRPQLICGDEILAEGCFKMGEKE